MATTIATATKNANQRVLTYPAGWQNVPSHCAGCAGKSGDCTAAVASQKDVITFSLADGRQGVVSVAAGSTDAQIAAAIQAWATANPLGANAVIGAAIV